MNDDHGRSPEPGWADGSDFTPQAGGTPASPSGGTLPRASPPEAHQQAHDPGTAHPGGREGADQAAASPAPDVDLLAGLVYDRISERIGQRGDTAGEMPSVEEAVALRERAPELYDLWLRIAQERAATGNYVQRAPYEVPERLAQSGRPRALSSLVVVLAFCGYLAWLGGPGPYIAGLIAVFDLVVMLALFFGLRPDHLSDPRHASASDPRHGGRKRLPATRAGQVTAATATARGPPPGSRLLPFARAAVPPAAMSAPPLRRRGAGARSSPWSRPHR